MHINAKATPINGNDYYCHLTAIELLTNRIGSISCHIMPLVINTLSGGHTQTHTHILTISIGSTLRNPQVASAPGLKMLVVDVYQFARYVIF